MIVARHKLTLSIASVLSAFLLVASGDAGAEPPAVTLAVPADGSATNDRTPRFSGTGTVGLRVKLRIYTGTVVTGNADVTESAAVDADGSWSVELSADLAEGTYTAQAEQTNDDDETGKTAARTFRVDLTAPNTFIDSGPGPLTKSREARVSFSASEEGSTFACKLDDGPASPCDGTAEYSDLADGSHTFSVTATDAAGNRDETPATRTWTVDTVPPRASIEAKPADPTNAIDATFEFSATEVGAVFKCQLDERVPSACEGTVTYTALADDVHTFELSATDAAGNTARTSYSWTVDTAPPLTALRLKPDHPSNDASPSFTFSSSEAASTFECSLDGAPFARCSNAVSYSALPDGAHTFEVKATDRAGNTAQTPTAYMWTIDTVAPATTVSLGPADPSNGESARFEFSASEEDATFECRLDGAAFAPCSSPKTYPGPLPAGVHTFAVPATDRAGNPEETPAQYRWTVDTDAPEATIGTKPANPSRDASPTFTFSSSEAGASFQCKLDTAAFEACFSPKTYAGPLADGDHTFYVKVTDASGNPATVGYTWTVDTTPPRNVSAVTVRAGDHVVTIRWANPVSDFDHLALFRPTRLRFEGVRRSYTDRNVFNGTTYVYRLFTYDRAGNRSSGVRVVARPTGQLLRPRDGSTVTRAPLLAWRPAPRASYYNVQLWRNGTKILSKWPTRARYALRASWTYRGRTYRLRRGTYRWYVWPGYGSPAAARYGRLLGWSQFRKA